MAATIAEMMASSSAPPVPTAASKVARGTPVNVKDRPDATTSASATSLSNDPESVNVGSGASSSEMATEVPAIVAES